MARYSKAAQERIAGYRMDEERAAARDYRSLKTFALDRPTAGHLEVNESAAMVQFKMAQRIYR